MKRRALILLLPLLAAARLFAQDDGNEFLKNSTFSDGTTYWHGDCKPAGSDSSTDFITSSSNASGIMVELHSSTWTKVTQELRGKAAPFQAVLTVTYQVSPGFKLSDHQQDYGNCGPSVGFGGAEIRTPMGQIVAFVDVPPLSRSNVSASGNLTQITIFDDSVSSANFVPVTTQSPQTFTVKLRPPPPTPDSHQTLCLAFPPGNGSITITKISLATGSANGSSPNP